MYVNYKQSVCNTTNDPCMLFKKLYITVRAAASVVALITYAKSKSNLIIFYIFHVV